jgi:hypothetical protein
VVVGWQDRNDRIVLDLFDAQKTVQYRRRGAFVGGLYNSLRREDSRLLNVERLMASG